MLFSILGARLYYVIFNWNYYGNNLLDIVKIWEGGLAIHGGILFGLIFIIFYTKKYKVNTWRMLDIVVVGLIIGFFLARYFLKRQIDKNPPINEKMIEAMMSSMGRKPSQKQVKQVMQQMNRYK